MNFINEILFSVPFSLTGAILGLISLGVFIKTYKKGPEALKPVVTQLILGVLLITTGFAWVIGAEIFGNGTLDALEMHHIFMASSIIFFLSAALKIYKIGR